MSSLAGRRFTAELVEYNTAYSDLITACRPNPKAKILAETGEFQSAHMTDQYVSVISIMFSTRPALKSQY